MMERGGEAIKSTKDTITLNQVFTSVKESN